MPRRTSGRHGAHIDRPEALRPILKVEFDELCLVEGAESIHLDCGVVQEHVGTSVELRDEPEAHFGVEPLDSSGSDDSVPLSSNCSELSPAFDGRPRTRGRADCHPPTGTLRPKKRYQLRSPNQQGIRAETGLLTRRSRPGNKAA